MKAKWWLTAVVLAAGCQVDVDVQYGRAGGSSVNGVRVFANLIRARGCKVRVARQLSPKLREESDVIVYFHESYGQLNEGVRNWLNDWLRRGRNRLLFLVVRDADCEPKLWRDVLNEYGESLSVDERARVEKRLQRSTQSLEAACSVHVPRGENDWFGLAPNVNARRIEKVYGGQANPDKEPITASLTLHRRLQLPSGTRHVLVAGGATLLGIQQFGAGQLWIVGNGEFLLNYAMVDPKNRELAVAVADAIAVSDAGRPRRVTFIERPRIVEVDTESQEPGVLRFLTIPPISWIAGHWIALAGVVALYRFPIFGRPRRLENREAYRFGPHIEAMGALLLRTRRVEFFKERIRRYLQFAAKAQKSSPPQEKP
jgi:hypothetical protein